MARPLRLARENSFLRLGEPLQILVSIPNRLREPLLEVIFRWPPPMVERVKSFLGLELVVELASAYQVLELLDRGADLHYQDPSGCFVPWGFRLREDGQPGTVVNTSGGVSSLTLDLGSGAGMSVEPVLPRVEVRTLDGQRVFPAPLRLVPASTAAPTHFWIAEEDVRGLGRLLDLDLPVCSRLAAKMSFRWFDLGSERVVLLTVPAGSVDPGLAEALATRAVRSFYGYFRDCVLVESGWTLSPELPLGVFRGSFSLGAINLFWQEDGEIQRVQFEAVSGRGADRAAHLPLISVLSEREKLDRMIGQGLTGSFDTSTIPGDHRAAEGEPRRQEED